MPESLSCNYYEQSRCRSCSLLPLGNRRAATHKVQSLELLLKERFPDVVLNPLVQVQNPKHSRSKVKVSVTGDLSKPIIGILDRDLKGIELLHCPLHQAALNDILDFVRTGITAFKLYPYEPAKRRGELKNIIITSNREASEIIVRFVLRTTDLMKRLTAFAETLQNAFPSIKVISLNLQPAHAAVLEGEEEILLTEKDHIWERYNGIEVSFGPRSFMQVTPEIAEKLYGAASSIVRRVAPDTIVDLFCGSGGFLLSTVRHAREGAGFELAEGAVTNARRSAVRNGVGNVTFAVKDLLREDVSLATCDLVIVNPPRRGLGHRLIGHLLHEAPRYILYSSCNPHSFLADCAGLHEKYRIVESTPFDMFPLTEHVELLSLLVRI